MIKNPQNFMEYHLSLVIAEKYKQKENNGTYEKNIIREPIITPTDLHIMNHKMERSNEKMKNNIKNIIRNISMLKKNERKKYQISGYHEYKIINEILNKDGSIEYTLHSDEKLTRNIVETIFLGYNSYHLYTHKKVPVLYIYVKKIL